MNPQEEYEEWFSWDALYAWELIREESRLDRLAERAGWVLVSAALPLAEPCNAPTGDALLKKRIALNTL